MILTLVLQFMNFFISIMLSYSNFEEHDDCKDFPTRGCGGIGDVLHPFLQSMPADGVIVGPEKKSLSTYGYFSAAYTFL